MNKAALITVGKKFQEDSMFLLSVFDLEPSGVIIHAYNQTDSKEYSLPVTEMEVSLLTYFLTYFLFFFFIFSLIFLLVFFSFLLIFLFSSSHFLLLFFLTYFSLILFFLICVLLVG